MRLLGPIPTELVTHCLNNKHTQCWFYDFTRLSCFNVKPPQYARGWPGSRGFLSEHCCQASRATYSTSTLKTSENFKIKLSEISLSLIQLCCKSIITSRMRKAVPAFLWLAVSRSNSNHQFGGSFAPVWNSQGWILEAGVEDIGGPLDS